MNTMPAILSLVMAGVAAAQPALQITGRVIDAARLTPVPGATVIAVRQEPAQGQSRALYRAVSQSDGRYAVMNVQPGSYRLCVHDASGYLDPCQWAETAKLDVSTSNVIRDIPLDRGVLLVVSVRDSQTLASRSQTAPASEKRPSGAVITASVEDRQGQIQYLPLRESRVTGYDYWEYVPADVDLTLRIKSRHFTLSDAKGVPIDAAGLTTPIRISQPAAPPAVSRWDRLPLSRRPSSRAARVVEVQIRGVASVQAQ